ncbi:hypothetical protein G6O69_07600 [Pseudenhygromyxa sp. WMMC2535]|uniref:hypothetical protein n=1 Tax=Pseudenhygromyxa sp. WMMC2535 TaxID=2712867 RepID=UPI0015547714|nr:hypothetical protein [Pseudenhygromyxa sp. WMMC2535]NVB37693.1 hypothetical protein [Pseudenhygromyxa sp. WMMC2535]
MLEREGLQVTSLEDEATHALDSRDAAGTEEIALHGEHTLEIRRSAEQDLLEVTGPTGVAGLCISIDAEGISLQVTGTKVTLATRGALAIRADELALHGNRGVTITSDADASFRAAGDIHTEGRIQTIRARLGNVNVEANDDVKLEGERIKLNA